MSLVNPLKLSAFLGVCLLLSSGLAAPAAVPTEPDERAPLIGQPTSVVVEPASIDLAGPNSMQQLVVTGKYADGTVRDLTHLCDIKAETADVVDVGPGGFLLPKQ